MIVTVNTDASYSLGAERGSFAFWIVSDSGRVQMSGMLKNRVGRPEQAEFQCIINAVHILIQQDWKSTSRVIINTDCLNVIHLIENNADAIRKYRLGSWGKYLKKRFNKLILESKLKNVPIEFRHIKAHVSTTSKKQWVNDWCDKEAKLQLNKFHNQNKTKSHGTKISGQKP